jgi:hypothetical protein
MKRVVLAAALAVVGLLGFFFVIDGGLDLFKPSVEVIIPVGYSGPVCGQFVPGSTAHASIRYYVAANGLMPIDEETLHSHRKWDFFSRASTESSVVQLPNDAMLPIFTESDQKTNTSYAVFWVGTPNSWSQFIAARSGAPVCLGRY